MASYNNNIMRMTGLVSGLDVESIVQSLMKTEQAKVDKVKQQKQLLQWQQDTYRSLIGTVKTFQSTYFDVLKGSSYMLSSKNISALAVSGSADTNGITVSAGADAVSGNYSINVQQLAQKATYVSDSALKVQNMSSPVYGVKIDSTNNKITINGTEITLDTEAKYSSINDVASAINSKVQENDALKGKVSAAVNSNGKIDFENLIKIDDSNKDITVNYDGHTYKVTLSEGNYTKDTLASAVSSALSGKASEEDPSVKFTSEASLTAKSDFSGFTVVDKDKNELGGATITAGSTTVTPIAVDLSGTSGTEDNPSRSNVKVDGNLLSYDNKIIEGFNDSFNVKIGETNYGIKLSSGAVSGLSDLVSRINTALTGSGINSNYLTAQLSDGNTLQFKSESAEQVIITAGSTASANGVIGASNYQELTMSTSQKMSDLVNGAVSFKVNGVDFNYDFNDSGEQKDKTIQDIMYDISSKSNVNISYSQLTGKFSISSQSEGSNNTISVSDASGNFINTLFGTGSVNEYGNDAILTITSPGQVAIKVTKNSNNFVIDGVNYQLNSNTTLNQDISFSLNSNTDEIVKNIEGFVEQYNSMITAFNDQLNQKRNYSYTPLTDDQKADMKDDDIKNWEDKAKQGLLKNNSELNNFMIQLRQSIYTPVEGVGLSMADIGITTSSDWSENGKLIVDEDKLKSALQNNGDKVSQLLTKQTSSVNKYYSPNLTSSQRDERYNDEGVFQRINDIIQDYTRTTRDSNGRKGIFLEQAGISGDLSDTTNYLTQRMNEKDDQITKLTDAMNDKENKYYDQYSKLEQALVQLQAQQQQLLAQLGQSS
ncbi:flagellar filament capping protein FliD [Clostridium kluyveri]|uniref:Flagellar hook-associated protein 2 n=2 Tax=Clostridium kluyveri TaxID=1534 RepID=A5MZ29_CLOK5|nr:flagellar filament capping protein FliD [Clostridium kluyveri]EDK34125.1 FliD [Clostridium kluyveri DSM 555]BAH06903.1 hypothetical protein CKR_1852 [Clostridium kluyveri NBRC 12016]